MGKSLDLLGDCLIGILVKLDLQNQNTRETQQAKIATLTFSALHVSYSLNNHIASKIFQIF